MTNTIDKFNEYFLNLLIGIGKACNKTLIVNNIDLLKNDLNTNKERIINYFVYYVLKYKDQIDKRDEQFFLNNSFKDDTNNDDILNKILEFKNIWTDLDNQNRQTVMTYMILLCNLAQEHFMSRYD
jgi:hypothetical protein